MSSKSVVCPICFRTVPEVNINYHLDHNCSEPARPSEPLARTASITSTPKTKPSKPVAPIFASSSQKPTNSVTQSTQQETLFTSRSRKRQAADHDLPEPGPSKRSKGITISSKVSAAAPLAESLRPQSLEEFVGQPHLTGPDSLLMSMLRSGATGSLLFWGPPGCGKTTLARLLAKHTDAVFKELSATDSGIADVRAVAEEARNVLKLTGRRTVLFLDEVHRFNKAQQDIFLPFIEQGIIQLIGATTENPSFKLNSALLSRCRVFILERLTDEDITQILVQAIERVSLQQPDDISEVFMRSSSPAPPPSSSSPAPTLPQLPASSQSSTQSSSGPSFPSFPSFLSYPHLTSTLLQSIVSLSIGDARTALSMLELLLSASPNTPSATLLTALRRSVATAYDRGGDARYDMISALHKSVRGSDGSAAMYWLARMLSAGEDPVYIARRMTVCASEDVGLADNHALPLAMATLQACQNIGMPECRINLAHLVAYLAEAPKSTRAYEAYKRAEEAAKRDPSLPVPPMVRNAPTRLMQELGYSQGYAYNPDYIHPVTNEYMPPQVQGEVFLRPAGDKRGKMWDEEALRQWEIDVNNGEPWEGRQDAARQEP